MRFLARLFARLAPATVRPVPAPVAPPEAIAGANLFTASLVGQNLVDRSAVGVVLPVPSFAPLAIQAAEVVATIRCVPLSWFAGRLNPPPGVAGRWTAEEWPADEPCTATPEDVCLEEPLLDCQELFLRDLGRHVRLPVDETNRLLGEASALGLIAEVPNGRRARRERQFHSDGDRGCFVRIRNRLIEGHWRLCLQWVREGAWPRRCQSMTEEDLFNEAVLGLARAVELFEPARETALGTYAFQWVRQALGRSRAFTDRLIRLPVHCQSERTLEPSEYRRLTRVLSFSEVGVPPADSLPDPRSADPADAASAAEAAVARTARLEVALQALTAREADVLRRRFGWDDRRDETLQEIADRLGISKERVRQIEAAALDGLGRGASRRLLEPVEPD